MIIGLLKHGWMTTSGSSLLKMMQNRNTPALDLIVRESIQNSVDAAKSDVKNVKVQFKYDDFDVDKLSKEFEGIGEYFPSIRISNGFKYLAIADSNTVGLLGNLNGVHYLNENNQNLGKLVFNIMQNQQNEGAGGSWGIGKTVYYRLGIGLVIYYSRVKLENGEYQNRLVAAYVEDETSPNGLLKNVKENNLGCAFFGEKYEDGINNLRAITDDEYISDFLSTFSNLKQYTGEETGTTIIIPFIDEGQALGSNSEEDEDRLWWCSNIEDFINVSILRWYYPRLSKFYPYGPRLIVSINDNPLGVENDTILFDKMQSLYNAAFSDSYPDWIRKKEITRKRNFKNDHVIGWFMYTKLPGSLLGMESNLPSPYKYCEVKAASSEYNVPIISYCRRPGMIINYNSSFKVKCNIDEFILGMFVLNSNNKLSLTNGIYLNLDEYIRKGEKSDHAMWYDYSIIQGQSKIQIVDNINSSIRDFLEKEFDKSTVISGQGETSSILAHKFGQKFLPNEGFGNAPKGGRGGTRSGTGVIKRDKRNCVEFTGMRFIEGSVALGYKIVCKDKIKSIICDCKIMTVSRACTAEKWEEDTNLPYPLSIQKIFVKFTSINNKSCYDSMKILTEDTEINNCIFKFKKSSKYRNYAIEITPVNEFVPFEMELKLAIVSKDKALQTNVDIDIIGD